MSSVKRTHGTPLPYSVIRTTLLFEAPESLVEDKDNLEGKGMPEEEYQELFQYIFEKKRWDILNVITKMDYFEDFVDFFSKNLVNVDLQSFKELYNADIVEVPAIFGGFLSEVLNPENYQLFQKYASYIDFLAKDQYQLEHWWEIEMFLDRLYDAFDRGMNDLGMAILSIGGDRFHVHLDGFTTINGLVAYLKSTEYELFESCVEEISNLEFRNEIKRLISAGELDYID